MNLAYSSIMLQLFIILVFIMLCVWIYAFFQANDFSVPMKKFPEEIKKILIIFPHADDELLTSGGLLKQLSNQGKEVYWIILTKGERGNHDAHLDENLGKIREEEAKKASQIYDVKQFIQLDYPDYQVKNHTQDLKQNLAEKIKIIQPNLIITYDLAGLYGHPDHVATSQVVTQLVKEDYPHVHLWYTTFPKKLLERVKLPDEMAEDVNSKQKRSYPNAKIFVGYSGIKTKIEVMKIYQSQQESFKKSFPIKLLPGSFYISLMQFEYFYEVN